MTQTQKLQFTNDGTSWAATDAPYTWVPATPSGPYWADMGSYWNSITLGWNAMWGAAYYNIYCAYTGQGKYLWGQTPYTSVSIGLGGDTYHQFWIAAVSGKGVESAHSGPHQVLSGHPEARKQGSFTFEGRPSATKTWRPSDGWTYSANGDDVLQGWFSASSNNAFGTMQHDGPGFQNWVASNYGWDVVSNMGWDDFALAMYRMSGTGTGSAVSQTYYVSPAKCSQGGQPPLAGGTAMGSHLPNNAGSWDRGLPNWWAGHVLRNEDVGNGPCWSFVMYRANSADYSRYGGLSDFGNSCNYYVACSWNFVTQNQQNTQPW
jgi:hypothetical protein